MKDRYVDGAGWIRPAPPPGQIAIVPIERRAKAFRFVTKFDTPQPTAIHHYLCTHNLGTVTRGGLVHCAKCRAVIK